MRVLFFSNSPVTLDNEGLPGSGNWVSSLIKSMMRYSVGYEIYAAYHDQNVKNLEFSEVAKNVTLIKIPTGHCRYKVGKIIGSWLFKDPYKNSLPDYLSIVNKIQPDIIQIFGFESPFIQLLGSTNIPIVLHIQGLLGPSLLKFYPYFSIFELLYSTRISSFLKANTLYHKYSLWKYHIKLASDKYRFCQYFFGRTDWDKMVTRAIAPHAKYFYCQEIMREGFYNHQWTYKKSKVINLVTVIRDEPHKNVNIIFETVSILQKYNPDFSFCWRIAGICETDLSVRIMKRRGFKSTNLKLLGKLNASELILEMLNANTFIYPSAIDNSPNALQEAMLLGIPIIATYAGGISSLIDHCKTGVLVPEGDPYSLAGAIINLNESGHFAESLGSMAREVALERNSPERVIDSLVSGYTDILLEKASV